jgi:formamidopyrimidine-DNA glycosylase
MLPKPKKIKNVKAFYTPIIKDMDPSVFIKSLIGQTFTDIDRYGKHLILKFNDYSIISHLRMEGKYIWYDNKFKKDTHDHIQFIFTDGNSLVYNDVRKFGTMHLVKKGEELTHPSISKLGPEVNDESTFTVEYL